MLCRTESRHFTHTTLLHCQHCKEGGRRYWENSRDTGQVCSHMPPRKRKDPAQPSLEAVTDEPVKTKTSRKGKLDQPVVQVQVTSLRHESLGPTAEALMMSAGTGWCKGRAFQETESSQDWTALLTQRH